MIRRRHISNVCSVLILESGCNTTAEVIVCGLVTLNKRLYWYVSNSSNTLRLRPSLLRRPRHHCDLPFEGLPAAEKVYVVRAPAPAVAVGYVPSPRRTPQVPSSV